MILTMQKQQQTEKLNKYANMKNKNQELIPLEAVNSVNEYLAKYRRNLIRLTVCLSVSHSLSLCVAAYTQQTSPTRRYVCHRWPITANVRESR